MTDQPALPRITLKASASFALATFKAHPGPLIGLAAVVTILQFISSVGSGSLQDILVSCVDAQSPGQVNACSRALDAATGPLTIAAIFSVLAVIALIGIQRASLDATLGTAPSFAALLSSRNLGRYLLYVIVSSLVIFVGLLLCVLPGLIALYLLQFGAYVVLDRSAGVGEAIRTSVRLVRAHPGPALSVLMVHIAGLLLGSLLLGVPTLVVLPFTTLFTAHAYRQFQAWMP